MEINFVKGKRLIFVLKLVISKRKEKGQSMATESSRTFAEEEY